LNVPVNTLRQRVSRLGIKPISQEAVYAPEVLDILKAVPGKGRPKKDAELEPTKPKAKKPAKPKK
jgi:hypothetical protein